jgi:2-C-methyl-D-erythritol 2,4-cyclodiphosphate synthase
MNIRIGFGYDVHKLKPGYKLFVGGINIKADKGAVGHSDGDVLIHAICDALLGAANLRDIGYHFPDTSAEFKNIDSKILLRKTVDLLDRKGYTVCNIDNTVCLENPKIEKYVPEMQDTLAGIIGINKEEISIKATTNEKLGYIGKEKGITAYSVVLITGK